MNTSEQLFEAALQAFHHAYAPYSGFAVGAAVLSTDNHIYSGCNVENISYPCGSCAEQSAISAMIASGRRQIKEILVLANGKDLITPCGACLQRIAEFSTTDTLVHLASPQAIHKTVSLAQLLPFGFTDKELQK